jgi:hypothetical protein
MNTISVILNAGSSGHTHSQGPQNSDASSSTHPTLNEIQIRAYRIHWQHGGPYGGYTLDDWLEAEHELDDELHHHDDVAPRKKKQRSAAQRGLVQ